METGESFWVSGVKKNGEDHHRAGGGKVLVEAAALSEYLKTIVEVGYIDEDKSNTRKNAFTEVTTSRQKLNPLASIIRV
jgi:hypothetical protein